MEQKAKSCYKCGQEGHIVGVFFGCVYVVIDSDVFSPVTVPTILAVAAVGGIPSAVAAVAAVAPVARARQVLSATGAAK